MAEKDYYGTLGIGKDASDADIKSAYKRLAKKYHPDVSKEGDAEAKFKDVLEAYNILSDPQKRANYDRFGDAAERFSGFGGSGGFGGFGSGGAGASHMEFDFGDLFENLGGFGGFGDIFGRGRQRGPARGKDIVAQMAVSFMDAAFGATKEAEIERMEACGTCKGTGAKGGKTEQCHVCRGRGVERHERRTMFGIFATQTTCRNCGGRGESAKDKCGKCNGAGVIKKKRKIKIKIPAGVNTGNHLRMQDEGQAGEQGAGTGDLFIVIFVEPHEIFKRDGIDIFAEIPLSFAEATLGTAVEVPTLRSNAKIKVPAGTQTGTIFKLRGQGIAELDGSGKGDEYVKVILKTPEKLSKRQRELFEEMAEEDSVRINREGFFERVRKHFK
ncbi:molecular chaperone DnaJ [Candidatus Micrarchaeota archaeon]|nr:molecular chaperone DnaJ [Candidatus Micrarchaeota archaeon]